LPQVPSSAMLTPGRFLRSSLCLTPGEGPMLQRCGQAPACERSHRPEEPMASQGPTLSLRTTSTRSSEPSHHCRQSNAERWSPRP